MTKRDPNARERKVDKLLLAPFFEKYRTLLLVLAPVFWLLSALGFSVLTPRITTEQLKALFDTGTTHLQGQITATRDTVHIVLQNQDANAAQLKILLKYDCVSQSVSQRDKSLIGLDCTAILTAPISSSPPPTVKGVRP